MSAVIKPINEYFSHVEVKKGDLLFKEGDESLYMYFLKEGELKVTKKLSKQNLRIQVNEIGPGELVGELAFIDRKMRSATVKAVTDCKLIRINHETYKKIMKSDNKLLKILVNGLVNKVRKLSEV